MGNHHSQHNQCENSCIHHLKWKDFRLFFQTRVCVSLEPKTNTVKLVVDGESIVEEVRLWCSLSHLIGFKKYAVALNCQWNNQIKPGPCFRSWYWSWPLLFSSPWSWSWFWLWLVLNTSATVIQVRPGVGQDANRPTNLSLILGFTYDAHKFRCFTALLQDRKTSLRSFFRLLTTKLSQILSRCLHAMFTGRSTQGVGQTWTYSQEPWLSGGW